MAGKLWLRVNKPMLGHEAGAVVEVAAKADGSPAELFWRRRLRDANREQGGDGCVTIVSDPSLSGTLPESEATPAAGSE